MPSDLAAWTLAALQSLPVYKEDVGHPDKPAQLEMISRAVTQAAREARGWSWGTQALIAAELSVIKAETNGSLRIHRNECRPLECDRGRAISLFQLHAVALSDQKLWPSLGFMTYESTLLSAKEASRALVRSRALCAKLPGDPIAMMFTAYAGRGCQLDKWQGWRGRTDTFNRLMRIPMPKVVVESQKQQD